MYHCSHVSSWGRKVGRGISFMSRHEIPPRVVRVGGTQAFLEKIESKKQ